MVDISACFFVFVQVALISPTDEQFDLLLRKLKERLDEGHGETIYEVGVGGEGILRLLGINE